MIITIFINYKVILFKLNSNYTEHNYLMIIFRISSSQTF